MNYNPERKERDNYDPTDSRDHFVHGILSPRRLGTCATLPVFAVAVGRRLGFPLKLVKVPEHLLFRWDDGVERFNIEYGGDGGMLQSDEYYRTWPILWDEKLHQAQRKYGFWLHSLTPKQEVAKFLELRGGVLDSLERFEEYVGCMHAAIRYNPEGLPIYANMLLDLQESRGINCYIQHVC